MGMDANSTENLHGMRPAGLWICYLLTALAAVVGLRSVGRFSLEKLGELTTRSSTFRWPRGGGERASSSESRRAGSPLTFWKLQQVADSLAARSARLRCPGSTIPPGMRRHSCRLSGWARSGSGWSLWA